MKPIEIRIELLQKGVTQAEIARSLDPPVTPPAVWGVINKTWISERIMKAVADAIGRDVKVVFHEHFTRYGFGKKAR